MPVPGEGPLSNEALVDVLCSADEAWLAEHSREHKSAMREPVQRGRTVAMATAVRDATLAAAFPWLRSVADDMEQAAQLIFSWQTGPARELLMARAAAVRSLINPEREKVEQA